MTEKFGSFEQAPELLPSEEDVMHIFAEEIAGAEFTERRKLSDAEGVYLWELEVKTPEGIAEYSYARKGSFAESKSIRTAVHVTFYDEDGVPNGGHSIARWEQGKWNRDVIKT